MVVRQGKSNEDRTTMLPELLMASLERCARCTGAILLRESRGTTVAEADRLTREKVRRDRRHPRHRGRARTALRRRNTPQYAIIDPQGVLRYAGAIDGRPSPSAKDIAGATNYVRAALDAGLAGQPIAVAQTQPYGCEVKY